MSLYGAHSCTVLLEFGLTLMTFKQTAGGKDYGVTGHTISLPGYGQAFGAQRHENGLTSFI